MSAAISRVVWTCPTAGCETVMHFAEIKSATRSFERIDYEAPCRKCVPESASVDDVRMVAVEAAIDDLYALDKRTRNAQRYLIEADRRRFVARRRERLRRWAHNALHRAQYAMGHTYCWACNELTHNRLRPMSHANRRAAP